MNNKKNRTGFVVLFVLIAAAIFFGIRNTVSMVSSIKTTVNVNKENPVSILKSVKSVTHKGGSYIAALYIRGVIEDANMTYNQDWLLSTIKDLKNDDGNKGIAIFIDSPGGGVYESDETYLALQEYRTTGRPIYVYQGTLAASGGYYISCAGNKIYANRNTLTGSIGIIMGTSLDLTELMEKLGIKSQTITSGKNKNMFNYNQPLTDEQKSIMQSIADEAYEQFTSIVSSNRNIPIDEVKALADGRIYTAKQALKLNLVDVIGTWDGMLDDMADDCFDGTHYDVRDFEYSRKQTLRDYIINGVFGGSPVSAVWNSRRFDRLLSEAMLRYPAYLYGGF